MFNSQSRVNDIAIIEEFYRWLINAVFPEQGEEPDATFADGEAGGHPQRHRFGDKSAFAICHFDTIIDQSKTPQSHETVELCKAKESADYAVCNFSCIHL